MLDPLQSPPYNRGPESITLSNLDRAQAPTRSFQFTSHKRLQAGKMIIALHNAENTFADFDNVLGKWSLEEPLVTAIP